MEIDITGAIEAAAWKREEEKWEAAYREDAERERQDQLDAQADAAIAKAASVVKSPNLRQNIATSLTYDYHEVLEGWAAAWWQVGPYIACGWMDGDEFHADVQRISPSLAEELGGARALKTPVSDIGGCAELGRTSVVGDGLVRVSINGNNRLNIQRYIS